MEQKLKIEANQAQKDLGPYAEPSSPDFNHTNSPTNELTELSNHSSCRIVDGLLSHSGIDKRVTSTAADGESEGYFDLPCKPQPIQREIQLSQSSVLRTIQPPKAFNFSHSVPDDFLGEGKARLENRNKSASEDRVVQPQPITTGLSPAVSDEGCSANGTTKVEEVKIKAEIKFNSEASHRDNDVSENFSCALNKNRHFSSSGIKGYEIISSFTPDIPVDKQDNLIGHILDPMRQALVGRIMVVFWLVFNHSWAARITQRQGDSSSTSEESKDGDQPVEKSSVTTSQQKRKRSLDDGSADESDNKKTRRQPVDTRPASKLTSPARFACPFRKHDSQKYSIHSHWVCAITSWDTISRVK